MVHLEKKNRGQQQLFIFTCPVKTCVNFHLYQVNLSTVFENKFGTVIYFKYVRVLIQDLPVVKRVIDAPFPLEQI